MLLGKLDLVEWFLEKELMQEINSRNLLLLFAAIGIIPAIPALAEMGNFEQLNLAAGFSKAAAVVTGYTSGAYSLSSIANNDIYGNPCIGYGDPDPDHTMVLENDFSQLILEIDSGGQDTTLIVRGPEPNTIRCNFGTDSNKDASIKDSNWKAGKYEIWVGSIKASRRLDYRLSVQQ